MSVCDGGPGGRQRLEDGLSVDFCVSLMKIGQDSELGV